MIKIPPGVGLNHCFTVEPHLHLSILRVSWACILCWQWWKLCKISKITIQHMRTKNMALLDKVQPKNVRSVRASTDITELNTNSGLVLSNGGLWNLWLVFPHNLSTLKENDCAAGALIWDLATDNWERVQVSEKPRRVNHAGIKMGDLLWCPKLWRLWAEDLGKRRDQSWRWESSCSTHVHQQGRLVHSAD